MLYVVKSRLVSSGITKVNTLTFLSLASHAANFALYSKLTLLFSDKKFKNNFVLDSKHHFNEINII